MSVGSRNIFAKYDEGLAFNYWGISSYTSAVKGSPIVFLDKLGYVNSADMKNPAQIAPPFQFSGTVIPEKWYRDS